MNETTQEIADRIAAAEAELEEIAAAAKVAWQHFRQLDQRQTAKADEIKELRRLAREA